MVLVNVWIRESVCCKDVIGVEEVAKEESGARSFVFGGGKGRRVWRGDRYQ